MKRSDSVNAFAMLAALAIPVAFALSTRNTAEVTSLAASEIRYEVPVVDGPHGPSVEDAGGNIVPIRRYERIVVASAVASSLAVELLERSRISAVSAWAADGDTFGHRYESLPQVARADDLETVLGFDPDLVLVHSIGAPAWLARLHDLDIAVFDFGSMTGVDAFVEDALQLGVLCEVQERAGRYVDSFLTRLATVAGDIPVGERPAGIYLGSIGGQLYGGTVGTSYHDVLLAGGLEDAAADEFTGWPQYDAADILRLDPDVIVTGSGGANTICNGVGLARLRVCDASGRSGGGIVEVPDDLIADPGAGILEAAEFVRRAVHGSPVQNTESLNRED